MIQKYVDEIRAHKLLAKQADQIIELVRPHIRIKSHRAKKADAAVGASRLAGEPDLPRGTPWPVGASYDDQEQPLDFIAQLDLDTVSRRDVDGLLPDSGVLAFFINYTGEACKVIHGEHDDLERVSNPTPKKRGANAPPPACAGVTLSADTVLPPPWSQFVCAKGRSATAYNSRTGQTGKPPTVVELTDAAHAAYLEIYDRWLDETGWQQHGLFGYDRSMEGIVTPDEHVLLRIDADNVIPYDFVEIVSMYFLITPDALAARDFDAVTSYCGSTI